MKYKSLGILLLVVIPVIAFPSEQNQTWYQRFTGLFAAPNFDASSASKNTSTTENANNSAANVQELSSKDQKDQLRFEIRQKESELKKLKEMGFFQKSVRFIEQGEYREFCSAAYSKIHTLFGTYIDAAVNNPIKTLGMCGALTWMYIFYSLKKSGAILQKDSAVSEWLDREIKVDAIGIDEIKELEKSNPGLLTTRLINYIYDHYRSEPGISSIQAEQQFFADLTAELEAAKTYKYWSDTLPQLIQLLVLCDDEIYDTIEERIDKLIYYRRLFLQWTDARDAAAVPSGGGMSGLSGMFG